MSKLESIIKEGTYKELSDYCDDNNLILKEEIDDGNYICSITDKDCDHNNMLNCMISDDDNLQLFIVNSDGKIIDTIENGECSDDILESIQSCVDVMNTLDDGDGLDGRKLILNEDGDDEVVEDSSEESTGNIVDTLNSCKFNLKDIADKIKNASDYTDDAEIASVIVDLASNAYSLILDIESAIETYNESQGIDSEDDSIEEESLSLAEETKSRLKVMESVSAMLALSKFGKVSKESYNEYMDVCNKIFS